MYYLLQFNFMTKFCQNMKKSKFLPVSRGEQEGRKMRFFSWCILVCLQSKSFLDTFILYFGINIGFLRRRNYIEELNLSSEHKIGRFGWFASFLAPGGREDMWLNPRICCRHMTEQNLRKNVLPICPWDFRTCPHPKNMSGTSWTFPTEN